MPDHVILLGASGFIGSSLAASWKRDHRVLLEEMCSSSIDFTGPASVEALCARITDETILVIAARARPSADEFTGLSNDLAIAIHIARCLAQCPVKKCVYFSTLSVYGDAATNLSITEETPVAPTTFYGAAKFTGECLLRQIGNRMGFPVVVVRPCKVYGPGDRSRAYGPVGFIESILTHDQVTLYGDGLELRDHLFINDLVRIVNDLTFDTHSGVFNLASGQSHTYQDLLAILKNVIHRPFTILQQPRTRDRIDQRIDISRLRQTVPGIRLTPLGQGLRETYESIVNTMNRASS